MYTPSAIPDDASPALRAWLANELRLIAAQFQTPVRAVPKVAAPNNPKAGQIEYAAGAWATSLGGEGFYGFEDGSWVRL